MGSEYILVLAVIAIVFTLVFPSLREYLDEPLSNFTNFFTFITPLTDINNNSHEIIKKANDIVRFDAYIVIFSLIIGICFIVYYIIKLINFTTISFFHKCLPIIFIFISIFNFYIINSYTSMSDESEHWYKNEALPYIKSLKDEKIELLDFKVIKKHENTNLFYIKALYRNKHKNIAEEYNNWVEIILDENQKTPELSFKNVENDLGHGINSGHYFPVVKTNLINYVPLDEELEKPSTVTPKTENTLIVILLVIFSFGFFPTLLATLAYIPEFYFVSNNNPNTSQNENNFSEEENNLNNNAQEGTITNNTFNESSSQTTKIVQKRKIVDLTIPIIKNDKTNSKRTIKRTIRKI